MSELIDSILTLNKAVQRISETVENLDPTELTKLLATFKEIDDAKDLIIDLAKMVNSVHSKLSYEIIPNTFESMGVDNISVKGYNFSVGTRFNANINEGNRQKAYEWLEANGLGAIIRPFVNPKSLSSAMRERFEASALLPPEDSGIKVHHVKYTSVRKK
jgi:hypothetical protein